MTKYRCPDEGWDHDHEVGAATDRCLVCDLRAEVAALRERLDAHQNDPFSLVRALDDAERELEQARALLARCADIVERSKPEDAACVCHLRMGGCFPHDAEDALRDTRAFLATRRDEGPRCTCPGDGRVRTDCPVHFLEWKPREPRLATADEWAWYEQCAARDEGPRCSCPPTETCKVHG